MANRKRNLMKSRGLIVRRKKWEKRLWQRRPATYLHWSTILSNLAQVALLIVITTGYFYSVRPLAQKELLAEQVSGLALERTKLESHVNELEGKTVQLLREISIQTRYRESLESELVETNEVLDRTKFGLESQAAALAEAIEELGSLEAAIYEAKIALYDTVKASVLSADAEVPAEMFAVLKRRSVSLPFAAETQDSVAARLK